MCERPAISHGVPQVITRKHPGWFALCSGGRVAELSVMRAGLAQLRDAPQVLALAAAPLDRP
ncbi:MAG: hypothetical protein ACK4IT_09910 [Thioalkalivibrionaceae bacterium]